MEIKKLMIIIVGGFAGLLALLALNNGGKDAAENRDAMYKRSKVFQDSIANIIKTSMDQAATPVPGGQQVPAVVNPTAQNTASGQATSTQGK
jgi:hypothetical protein